MDERPMSQMELLDYLVAEKKQIYVLNKSNPRGIITITAYRPDGQPMLLKVPKTWIPINVLDQVTVNTIENSDDFRSIVNRGMLEIILPKKARAILSDPDATIELNKLNVSKYGGNTPSISEAKTVLESSGIDIVIQDIMARSIADNEKLNSLRNDKTDNWTKADYQFIIANTDNQKIKKWATSFIE